jgi:hypothetical protein
MSFALFFLASLFDKRSEKIIFYFKSICSENRRIKGIRYDHRLFVDCFFFLNLVQILFFQRFVNVNSNKSYSNENNA